MHQYSVVLDVEIKQLERIAFHGLVYGSDNSFDWGVIFINKEGLMKRTEQRIVKILSRGNKGCGVKIFLHGFGERFLKLRDD